MKSTLTIFLTTTAVIGALGLPALSAIGLDPGIAAAPALTAGSANDGTILLASNDDDTSKASSRDSDDVDDDDDDCDDDHKDEGACRRTAPAPAQTGPMRPPANGLFSPGAAPQVRTN